MSQRAARALVAMAACLWLAGCAAPGSVVVMTPIEEQAPEEVQVPSPLVDYPPVEPVEPPLDMAEVEPPPAPPPTVSAASPAGGAASPAGGAAPEPLPDPAAASSVTPVPAEAPPATFSAAPAPIAAAIPTPARAAPPSPAPPPPPPQDQELLALLSDLQRYGSLGSDDVRRELTNATNALARHRSDSNRIRLAVLYSLSRGNPQDDQRAILLLDNVVKGNGANAGIKELAMVLHVQITSRQRAVRDEQQKADAALQKLEALREMERSLIRDRVRSGGGGSGGSGGGSGGGGGGGGG